MSSCCCSLAGTAACRSCSNNPYADFPPTVRTNTVTVTDRTFYTQSLPSAPPANSSKISYSVICEKFPNPHIYFNTYDEAEHWARFNQPNDRPYYIIKRSEHFEIVGEVR